MTPSNKAALSPAIGIVVIGARDLPLSNRHFDRERRTSYVVAKVQERASAAASPKKRDRLVLRPFTGDKPLKREYEAYFRTKVSFSAACPRWNQQFVAAGLPAEVVANGVVVFCLVTTETANGVEEVLGKCVVPLSTVSGLTTEPRWLPLKSPFGSGSTRARGALCVLVVLRTEEPHLLDEEPSPLRSPPPEKRKKKKQPPPASWTTSEKPVKKQLVHSATQTTLVDSGTQTLEFKALKTRRRLEEHPTRRASSADATSPRTLTRRRRKALSPTAEEAPRRVPPKKSNTAVVSSSSSTQEQQPQSPTSKKRGLALKHLEAVSVRLMNDHLETSLGLALLGGTRALSRFKTVAKPLELLGYFVGAPRGWRTRTTTTTDEAAVRLACLEAARRHRDRADEESILEEIVARLRGFEAFALCSVTRRALLVFVIDLCGGHAFAKTPHFEICDRLNAFAESVSRPSRTAVAFGAQRAATLATSPRRRVVRRALVLGWLAHVAHPLGDRELALAAAALEKKLSPSAALFSSTTMLARQISS